MPSGGLWAILGLLGLFLASIVAGYVAGRRTGQGDLLLARDAAEDLERELERARAQAAEDLAAEVDSHERTRANFRAFAERAREATDGRFREALARVAAGGDPDSAFEWVLRLYPEPEAPQADGSAQDPADRDA